MLAFPKAKLKLTKDQGIVRVWCVLRKKHLVLTPEEWVRQHLIHYLIDYKNLPIERIVSELLLPINGQNRRCDLAFLDSQGEVQFIAECKASEVALSETTFLQVSNYVQQTKARYFLMTNGLQHVIMDCITGTYLNDLPEF
jgi:hypothetical protein